MPCHDAEAPITPNLSTTSRRALYAQVLEVLSAARRIGGADIPAEMVARRPGDPAAVYADNRKAAARLGWSPRYQLEQIVATAWQWHRKHPDGFSAL
jgi:UDP-glucose 4-epimerase